MKTTVLRLICLLVVIAPMAAASQTGIRSAFDAIIKSPQAEIAESHGLSKDRETNIKSGQYDSYTFELPAGNSSLIKNVLRAFDTDMDKAYYIKTGKNNSAASSISLFSGDADGSAIPIDDPGYDYIYALFAPSKSEDPEGTHRYAYGFNYREAGDGKIMGRIVISYATTSEYREKENRARQLEVITDLNKSQRASSDISAEQSWFDQMMACVTGIQEAGPTRKRIALATKAYNLVKNIDKYPDVTPEDKVTMQKIITLTLNTLRNSGDPVSVALLSECIPPLTK